MKKIGLIFGLAILAFGLWVYFDSQGNPESAGIVSRAEVPAASTNAQIAAQAKAAAAANIETDKQILFGDLHVHSTFSIDAFFWSLPMTNGEGVHPPADACDYARFCGDLDFWGSTDHAESLTPTHWDQLRDMVQQCNAVSGDPKNPDLVTFLGWEWTQVGKTKESHYGHRNVILRDVEDDKTPARPIAAGGIAIEQMRNTTSVPIWERLGGAYIYNFESRQNNFDFYAKQDLLRQSPICESGVHVKELPKDCVEFAESPGELLTKLDQWGFDSLVIPHGTSWGFYTPPGTSFTKQLTNKDHDPKRQRLVEVFSGHGNSEEYRDWRSVAYNAAGQMVCPEATADYQPCCQRAGELIQARCDDPSSELCKSRVEKAKSDYLAAGVAGNVTVPGTTPEDWLQCGQCTDCFLPALNYRPGNSVQFMLSQTSFDDKDEDGQPLRFRFGFIASSDNHAAQPGTGYKEVDRHKNTEVAGMEKAVRDEFLNINGGSASEKESKPFNVTTTDSVLFQYGEAERLGSYFFTGGLAAVHSPGRDRDSIYDSLHRKETYATSGDRILLWFDLLGKDGKTYPMGSELRSSHTPRFRARAIGAFEQEPGCPEHAVKGLGEERLEYMCGGECYNPSDTRKTIDRIEVIRIKPQANADELVAPLIEDPWKTFQCSGDANGCQIEFEDPEFKEGKREFAYYVRAIQAPSPTVNGGTIQCTSRDSDGQCNEVDLCHGDERDDRDDDCLADSAERAWSSPIYVRPM